MNHNNFFLIILSKMDIGGVFAVLMFFVFCGLFLYGLLYLLNGPRKLTMEERNLIDELKKKNQLELLHSNTTLYKAEEKKEISFSLLKVKDISQDGTMRIKFPNFYTFCNARREIFEMASSKDDVSKIEFKFPIITVGRIMGFHLFGIEKKSGSYNIYMDCVSKFGHKIVGKRIPISSDQTNEQYKTELEELMIYLLTETEHRLIGFGQI